MPINKNAFIRFQILDKCFRNTMKEYSMDELIYAVDEMMGEIDSNYRGISRKQIYSDINFMESEMGWEVDLDKNRKNKKVYYRYSDPDFSINSASLREHEIDLIFEALNFLTRFKELPEYQNIHDIAQKLGCRKQKLFSEPFIIFDHNPYLHGLENFSRLFFAIKNHECIEVHYQNFHESPKRQIVSPYFLKEYNLRWFLVGFSHPKNAIRLYALDRIICINKTTQEFLCEYKPDTTEYFDDVIGVTCLQEFEIETFELKINKKSYHYVLTKPIHHSQRVIEKNDEFVKISVNLKYNYEFQKLVMSLGDAVEVLKPIWFRNKIRETLFNLVDIYK